MIPLISQFIDEEMEPAVQTAFEEHLGFCDDCWAYIEHTRRAIELVAALPRRTPDASLVRLLRGGSGA